MFTQNFLGSTEEYDAVILDLGNVVLDWDPERILQSLEFDSEVLALLQAVHHQPTATRVTAERAMNRRLEGGCQVPIACYAEFAGDDGQLPRAMHSAMSELPQISVGIKDCDIVGDDNRAIQAAVFSIWKDD